MAVRTAARTAALLALRRTKRLPQVSLGTHLIEALQGLLQPLDLSLIGLLLDVRRLQHIHDLLELLEHVLKLQSDLANLLDCFSNGAMSGRRRWRWRGLGTLKITLRTLGALRLGTSRPTRPLRQKGTGRRGNRPQRRLLVLLGIRSRSRFRARSDGVGFLVRNTVAPIVVILVYRRFPGIFRAFRGTRPFKEILGRGLTRSDFGRLTRALLITLIYLIPFVPISHRLRLRLSTCLDSTTLRSRAAPASPSTAPPTSSGRTAGSETAGVGRTCLGGWRIIRGNHE